LAVAGFLSPGRDADVEGKRVGGSGPFVGFVRSWKQNISTRVRRQPLRNERPRRGCRSQLPWRGWSVHRQGPRSCSLQV